jgi:hypothetical protein
MKFELVNNKDLDKYLEKDDKLEVKFKELESYANNLEGFSFMSIQDASTLFNYKDNIRAFYFEEYLKGNILKDFLDKVSCYDSEVSFSIGKKRDYIKVLVTINYE